MSDLLSSVRVGNFSNNSSKLYNETRLALVESPQIRNKRFKTLSTKEILVNTYNKEGTVSGVTLKLGVGATTVKRYGGKHQIDINNF